MSHLLPGKHETLLLWRDSLDFLHLALDVQNLTRNSVVNQVNTPVIAMTDGVSTATRARTARVRDKFSDAREGPRRFRTSQSLAATVSSARVVKRLPAGLDGTSFSGSMSIFSSLPVRVWREKKWRQHAPLGKVQRLCMCIPSL